MPNQNNFNFSFDTESKAWEIIKPMNVARRHASAAVANGYIYVAGGTGLNFEIVSAVECYNPKSGDWVELAPMNKPRRFFALIKSNGFLHAIGGGQAVLERYDPWNSRWAEVRAQSLAKTSILSNLNYRIRESYFRSDPLMEAVRLRMQ